MSDATARFVAMHARIGSRDRPHRVPRSRPPLLIESEYATQLVSFVQEWRAAIAPLIRRDDITRSKPTLDKARSGAVSSVRRTPVVAERTARRVAQHVNKQIERQTEAALGVAVPTMDYNVEPRIRAFIQENVALIQKLGNRTLDDVETILTRAYAEGLGEADIADELIKRFDIAERHARFIARDQVQRLYSQVTRMKHKEVGVSVFRWKTQEDGHVRTSHRLKSNKLFPYEGSRAPSFFPGDETGCRCYEEPTFEEIKAKVRALAGKGRRRVA